MTKRKIIEFLREQAEIAYRNHCIADLAYEADHPKEQSARLLIEKKSAFHLANILETIYFRVLGKTITQTKNYTTIFSGRPWKKKLEYLNRTKEIYATEQVNALLKAVLARQQAEQLLQMRQAGQIEIKGEKQ